MSKRDYPYPQDEFDLVDPNSRPKEAHAAKRSLWSVIWPFLVVIIVVPILTYLGVQYYSTWRSPTPDTSQPPASTATDGQSTGLVGEDPTETTPPPPPTTPDEPVSSPADEDTQTPLVDDGFGVANSAAHVEILNATGVDGLAGRTKDRLEGNGWSNIETGDYTGTQRDGLTTVYYTDGDEKMGATAQALADALGITEAIEENTSGTAGTVILVLRSDFEG